MYNLFECSDDETYEISSDLVCASVDQELYTVHPLYGEHSSLLSMEKAIGFYLQYNQLVSTLGYPKITRAERP